MITLSIRPVAFLATFLALWNTCRADVFVAVGGDDANPGTEAKPVATLRHARDLTRKETGHPRSIIVQPGTYYDVSVELGPEDSGLTIEGSRKGRVILCGGELVKDWKRQTTGWLAADLPPYPLAKLDFPTPTKNWEIRNLSVNNQWRPRARYPATGYLTNLNEWTAPFLGTVGGSWENQPTEDEKTILKYRQGDIPDGIDLGDAEVTVYHVWDAAFGNIKSRDSAKGELHLSPAGPEPVGAFHTHNYVLWNIPLGLTAPGQWIHERRIQRLQYAPKEHEPRKTLEVVAPAALTIIGIKGTTERPARDIVLRNLVFTGTTVSIGSGGTMELNKQGALSLDLTDHCLFAELTFERVGGWGIQGHGHNKFDLVEQCTAQDCGAGGIALRAGGSKILNNTVREVGLSFPASTGIVYHGSDGEVISNRVQNCPYAGIGGGNGANVVIGWNAISNAMSFLRDAGGIYVGGCTNYYIHNNFITAVREEGGVDSWGIYLDEHTYLSGVENNLVTRAPYGFHAHFSFTNNVHANIFSSPGDLTITSPRSGDTRFAGNLLDSPGHLRVEVPESDRHWEANRLYRAPKSTSWIILDRYAEIRREPMPGGALVGEPSHPAESRNTLQGRAAPVVPTPSFPIPRLETVGRTLL